MNEIYDEKQTTLMRCLRRLPLSDHKVRRRRSGRRLKSIGRVDDHRENPAREPRRMQVDAPHRPQQGGSSREVGAGANVYR